MIRNNAGCLFLKKKKNLTATFSDIEEIPETDCSEQSVLKNGTNLTEICLNVEVIA